ncbi:MAG: HAMP domain-containing protein [Planctomycetes bacterium]|nr:HAMP domain-containing protein [Planctomycetota bacterium]
MSLRSKVVLFVLGVSATFAGTAYLVQRLIVLPGFAKVEQAEALDDLARCQQAIEHDAEFLSNSANDYAAWDDTYDFIENGNEEYQSENLIPETFQNLKLNIFAFVRKDGTLVWGEVRTNQGQEPVDPGSLFTEVTDPRHRLVAHASADEKTFGAWMTPLGPALVGSAPITTSDRTGEVRGAVIMGRFITSDLVQQVADRTRVPLQLTPLQDLPVEDRAALSHLSGDEPWINAEQPETLVGYTLVRDILERPALLLRADLPRTISQKGRTAAAFAAVTSIGGGAVMMLVMWVVLSMMIVGPLTRVTSHAVRVGSQDDLHVRLNMAGGDEIAVLARELDRMVDRLAESRRQLLSVAHNAGMAQVATNILHNVGNVLSGVNVSAALIKDQLQKSEAGMLGVTVKMLSEHEGNLAEFLTSNERGRQLPAFLGALAQQLAAEQKNMLNEVQSLAQAIEHIRHIVDMQQQNARLGPLVEVVEPAAVVEQAIELCAESIARHDVHVTRALEAVEPVPLDRHRVLQVLVNLLTNAIQAVKAQGHDDRRITVTLRRQSESDGGGLVFGIEDNGVGIPPENLERIFSLGFTTRPGGQGVGLHSAANLAREAGGCVRAASGGPGRGAAFELLVPLTTREVPV